MQENKTKYYWKKFLKSGSVIDYLNYRMYKGEEIITDEPNTKTRGDSNQEE